MRPLVKYRGGKSREIPHLLPFLPSRYRRYVEPFFGGGALFFYLEPDQALINDLNPPLMDFYKGVRDDFRNLKAELRELETLYIANRVDFERRKAQARGARVVDSNETLYYRLRQEFNKLSPATYSPAAIYYFLNKTAYSGMIRYNRRGEYNVPYGHYKTFRADTVSAAHSRLLQRARVTQGDYAEVLARCDAQDFVFLDPPYDCVFSDYGNRETAGGFGETEQRRLAAVYRALPAKALMIIGKTPLTSELYRGMVVGEYEKNYTVNIRNRFKSASTHLVVANY